MLALFRIRRPAKPLGLGFGTLAVGSSAVGLSALACASHPTTIVGAPGAKSDTALVSTEPRAGASSAGSSPKEAPQGAGPKEIAPAGALPAPPHQDLIPHEYHLVTSGYGSLMIHEGVPRWFADGRIVDLRDGRVELETYAGNFALLRGDSLWYGDKFSSMSACPEPSTFLKLEKGKWRPRFEGNVHSLSARAWVPGSTIGAIVPMRLGPPWGYELVVLEKNRTPPRAARRTKDQKRECATRIDTIEGMIAFPSGEIFVLGTECEHERKEVPPPKTAEGEECWCDAGPECPAECLPKEEEDFEYTPLSIEVFAQGRHEFLPYPFKSGYGLFGSSPTDLWTVGALGENEWAFAHFDGKSWTVLPERYSEQPSSVVVSAGNAGESTTAKRLFLSGKKLLEVAGGKTREHQLPPGCEPDSFDVDTFDAGGEHLWVFCVGSDEKLFTTRKDIPELPPYAGPDPEKKLTSLSPENLPRLDPSAPSLRSCGSSRQFDTYTSFSDFDGPPPLKSKVQSSKPPTMPRPSPNSKLRIPFDEF